MSDTVLVIEDEADVVDLLRYHLKRAQFGILIEKTGDRGLQTAQEKRPDLIILDLMLPGMNGHEVCRGLKSHPNTETIPVIMLTARGEPHERVKGLELGADDYVTKPFSPRELVLRVQALLKRHRMTARAEMIEVEGIAINKTSFEARLDNKRLHLTLTEFKLLSLLLENRGRVLSRDALLHHACGYENTSIDTRTVDTHIRRLREKLGKYSQALETIRSEGYRFNTVTKN